MNEVVINVVVVETCMSPHVCSLMITALRGEERGDAAAQRRSSESCCSHKGRC